MGSGVGSGSGGNCPPPPLPQQSYKNGLDESDNSLVNLKAIDCESSLLKVTHLLPMGLG